MAEDLDKSVATNKFHSLGLFYNRELYKTKTYPQQSYDVQPIDFWYVSAAYGKVDRIGNTIAVNPAYLKSVKSTNNEELFAMNFVADAFKDLRNYLGEAGFQNKIETEETEYFDLQPYRGWTSLDVEVDNYMQGAYDAFFEGFMADKTIDQKVTNFKSFCNSEILSMSICFIPAQSLYLLSIAAEPAIVPTPTAAVPNALPGA